MRAYVRQAFTADEFIQTVNSMGKGSIDHLEYMGHGGILESENLPALFLSVDSQGVRHNLTSKNVRKINRGVFRLGAQITLTSCNSATPTLTKLSLAQAFMHHLGGIFPTVTGYFGGQNWGVPKSHEWQWTGYERLDSFRPYGIQIQFSGLPLVR
jgi:hypothetical protein